ncbi:MAG: glutaminyl-peptide cyclotransferase [Agriterribacter sp.]
MRLYLKKYHAAFLLLFVCLLYGCGGNDKNENETTVVKPQPSAVPMIQYTLINSTPHDTMAFIEGFCWHKGKLYESTGSPDELPETKSYFGVVNTTNGKVEHPYELDRNLFFGEGIAIIGDTLFQLTYKNQKGFVYNLKKMKMIGEFGFSSKEGWGMTTDGTYLIMTDGTNTITYINPHDFKTVKTLSVTENGNAIANLNELEFVNGSLFVNVYETNTIVKIDTATGAVTGKLDLWYLAKLAKDEHASVLEMNGIAYNADTKLLYITGKMWPKIFEIRIN